MPGSKHVLGTHLHAHYKSADDRRQDYRWTIDSIHSPGHCKEIFADQISVLNDIFASLGRTAIDNTLFHGSQVRPAYITSAYGIQPNENSYPNVFTTIEGKRRLYHPYRSSPNSDVAYGNEDLSSPFVAVPSVSGMLGFNEFHGPEGMLYATLPYVKKDFMLEYLEWRYYQVHDLPSRPWVYGYDIHPYQLLKNTVGTDGRSSRETMKAFYQWMNDGPAGSIAEYHTITEVKDMYLSWEKEHPGECMYSASSGESISGSGYTALFKEHLNSRENPYFFIDAFERDNVVVIRLQSSCGNSAYLYFTNSPDRASLPFSLSETVTGRYLMIGISGVMQSAELSSLRVSTDPTLLMEQ
jgi:hypothetical protein